MTALLQDANGNEINPLVVRALEYILQNYAQDVSQTDLAAALKISTAYLSRLFKSTVGENFIYVLNMVRIQKAKELLRHSGHHIFEVAQMTGFTNAKYFNKVFKRFTGMTPSSYSESGEMQLQGIQPDQREELP